MSKIKFLALVPARGGSKRLPRKNLKLLGDIPLLAWTLNTAKEVFSLDEILVSTDDEEIRAVSYKLGVLAPWLRPSNISDDKASSVDVALHAIEWYEKEVSSVDALVLLQPTTPFRSPDYIKEGMSKFEEFNGRFPVIGVTKSKVHPIHMMKINNGLMEYSMSKNERLESEISETYIPNGSLYIVSKTMLTTQKSFFNERMLPIKTMSEKASLDIDTEFDFSLACALNNMNI